MARHKTLILSIALLLLIFVIPIGYALPELIIDVEPIKNKISYDEIAIFTFEVTNNQDVADVIRIPVPDTKWSVAIGDYILEIPAHSSVQTNVSIAPVKNVKAGVYSMQFYFNSENNRSTSAYKYIHITLKDSAPALPEPPKIENISIEEEVSVGFLSENHLITIKNSGNVAVKNEFSKEFTLLQSFFVSEEPLREGIRTISNGKEIYWYYSLEPGEETSILYSFSYIPLLIAGILLAIALLLLAFYYSTKFRVIKGVIISKTPKNGPKTIKIKINVKNKTGSEKKNIALIDYIPTPLKLVKKFGTIEPDVIKQDKDQLKLIWKFDKLEAKEERVMSYELKSQMEVIGKVGLPQAVLKHKEGKKGTIIYSKIKSAKRI